MSGSHFSVVQQRNADYKGSLEASKKRTNQPNQEKRKSKSNQRGTQRKMKAEKEARTTEKK